MPRKPGDLGAALQRAPGVCVPEENEIHAARRSVPRDELRHGPWRGRGVAEGGLGQRGIRRPHCRGRRRRSLLRLSAFTPPPSKEIDNVLGEVDVASLMALRGRQRAARARAPHADDRVHKVNVAPAAGEKFSLPYALFNATRKSVLTIPSGSSAKRRGSSLFSKYADSLRSGRGFSDGGRSRTGFRVA